MHYKLVSDNRWMDDSAFFSLCEILSVSSAVHLVYPVHVSFFCLLDAQFLRKWTKRKVQEMLFDSNNLAVVLG